MSLIARLMDLFQAKTHRLLDALENPEDGLDLSYEKMIAGLQQTRRHLADVVTERTALERQIAAARAEAGRAEDDARAALAAGREDLARAALRHKQSALQKTATLCEAHAALVPQIDRLVAHQRTLEQRIERFRTDKEVMRSSYAAARAQVRVTEALTGVGGTLGGTGDTLRRARDRVEGMQARAEGMTAMLEQGLLGDPLDDRGAAERELHELRATSAIDADLDRLKAEAGMTAPPRAPLIEGQAEPGEPDKGR